MLWARTTLWAVRRGSRAEKPWPGTCCASVSFPPWILLDLFLLETTWGWTSSQVNIKAKHLIFCLFCAVVFNFSLSGEPLLLYHPFCNRNSLFNVRKQVSYNKEFFARLLLPLNSSLRILIFALFLIYHTHGNLSSLPGLSFQGSL